MHQADWQVETDRQATSKERNKVARRKPGKKLNTMWEEILFCD